MLRTTTHRIKQRWEGLSSFNIMNPLSIEEINKKSPYEVAILPNGTLSFDTDYGVSYNIGFDPDESIWQDGAYQFYIANANKKTSPNDYKIKETILIVIEEFFRSNPSILLYLCETGDLKQAARNRLFTRWFNTGHYKETFYFKHACIVAEGVENYAAIIVQRSNPHLSNIIDEFVSFVEIMQNKPEA